MDKKATRKKLVKSLKHNYYYKFREWPYKNVKPRIMCEEFIGEHDYPLTDYKFYCFDGEPKFLYISQGLDDHANAIISYVTLDWEIAPFYRDDYSSFAKLPDKPELFDEMINVARHLSKGIPFLRVDLYQVSESIKYSELTFYPGAGFNRFIPQKWDMIIGEMLQLPN